jgi:hypothetical protein
MIKCKSCEKHATYGIAGNVAEYCNTHKLEGMVDVKHPKCAAPGCTSRPNYDVVGGKGTYCNKHKIAGMVDVKTKGCAFEGCTVNKPNFGIKGKKERYCSKHKTPDMVDLNHKTCQFVGCGTRANFDIPGGKGTHCSVHKKEGMVDVNNPTCIHEGCTSITPCFNYKGEKQGRYCSTHKLDGMVDVRHKMCEVEGCLIQATFNEDTKNSGKYCTTHKSGGMIAVRQRKCEYAECNICPSYGIDGGRAQYCKGHKTEEMVDVVSARCVHDGCVKQPAYDYPGSKGRGRYCAEHRKEFMIDMINACCKYQTCDSLATFGMLGDKAQYCGIHKLAEMVDLKHNICDNVGCITRAYYGKPGSYPSKCWKHKLPGMIIRSNSSCLFCSEPAIYGSSNKAKHCEKHKEKDEQNYCEFPCVSCGLLMILNIDKKCEYCAPGITERKLLRKQTDLMNYLDEHGLPGLQTDVVIDGGICGRERPDRIYEADDFIIIVECDEDQHKGRNCECEQTRMVNIGQSFGGIPVYFIRFNPDKYKPGNKKIGCEKILQRYKLLESVLNASLKRRIELPNALVSVLYLFFDGWNGYSEENWKIITEFEKDEISHS